MARGELRRCHACFTCIVCGTRHSSKEGFAQAARHCRKCKQEVECDVCGEQQKWTCFPQAQLDNKMRNTHRRCAGCHVCARCKEPTRPGDFDGPAKSCRRCETEQKEWICEPCGIAKEATHFDAKNLKKHQVTNRTDKLVCHACRADGYTPADVYEYPCQLCDKTKGNEQFDRAAIQAYSKANAPEKSGLLCTSCHQSHERALSVWLSLRLRA